MATFGKPGRPPEDRLLRQREIFEAVAPLILRDGARRLSMHDAAHAACLSIGGLYHYFPTKRDLVLHGLDWEARSRICLEQRAGLGDISNWRPAAFIDAYLDSTMRIFAFMRPSIIAALDFGDDTLQGTLEAGLTRNVGELVDALRLLMPDLSAERLASLARSIRRLALGALVERNVDLAEVRADLRTLIGAHVDAAASVPAA